MIPPFEPDQQRFEKLKGDSTKWFERAESLNISACALWDSHWAGYASKSHPHLQDSNRLRWVIEPTCWMLVGLAIEVLLKAICVKKGAPFKPNHKLIEHAAAAGVHYSCDQQLALDFLTGVIYWQGKYPVPKDEGGAKNLSDQERKKVAATSTVKVLDSSAKQALDAKGRAPHFIIIRRPDRNWQSFQTLWKIALQTWHVTENLIPVQGEAGVADGSLGNAL